MQERDQDTRYAGERSRDARKRLIETSPWHTLTPIATPLERQIPPRTPQGFGPGCCVSPNQPHTACGLHLIMPVSRDTPEGEGSIQCIQVPLKVLY